VRDAEHSYLALDGLDEDRWINCEGIPLLTALRWVPNKAVKFSPCKRCLLNAILNVRFGLRFQSVDATHWPKRSLSLQEKTGTRPVSHVSSGAP